MEREVYLKIPIRPGRPLNRRLIEWGVNSIIYGNCKIEEKIKDSKILT